jgi:type IV pilus assembly protein PilV
MDQVTRSFPPRQRGITLVEVLVTLVILAIGLLGLIALQARVQVLQAEAYQRAQALMLLKDMAGRLSNNRNDAAGYDLGGDADDFVGAGATCPATGTTRRTRDIAEWCAALQGAGERLGASNVGAMVGGRGCIRDVGDGEFLITVAWQGLAPVGAPPTSVPCGAGFFGAAGTPCAGDVCRRVVTTVVIIPDLDEVP